VSPDGHGDESSARAKKQRGDSCDKSQEITSYLATKGQAVLMPVGPHRRIDDSSHLKPKSEAQEDTKDFYGSCASPKAGECIIYAVKEKQHIRPNQEEIDKNPLTSINRIRSATMDRSHGFLE
jgi:hypothetical protein